MQVSDVSGFRGPLARPMSACIPRPASHASKRIGEAGDDRLRQESRGGIGDVDQFDVETRAGIDVDTGLRLADDARQLRGHGEAAGAGRGQFQVRLPAPVAVRVGGRADIDEGAERVGRIEVADRAELDHRAGARRHVVACVDIKVETGRAGFAVLRHVRVERAQRQRRLQVGAPGQRHLICGADMRAEVDDARRRGRRTGLAADVDRPAALIRSVAAVDLAGQQPRPHLVLDHQPRQPRLAGDIGAIAVQPALFEAERSPREPSRREFGTVRQADRSSWPDDNRDRRRCRRGWSVRRSRAASCSFLPRTASPRA